MKHKLAVKLSIAACTICASSFALAAPAQIQAGDRITLTSTPWGGAYGGGAFLATDMSRSLPTFETFCVEYNEEFYYGQSLYVKAINTGAEGGGLSGQTSSGFDPISAQTAYLYTKFSNGALSNYEYGTSLATRAEHTADSTALQLAFWKLEGEIGPSLTPSAAAWTAYNSTNHIGVEARAWVAEAYTYAGTGIGNVRVLNLYTDSGYRHVSQDQLYLSPVPEPETYAMILAGLGLMGFIARRRKQNAAA